MEVLTCEACGEPGPGIYRYADGGAYHDQCAEECGIPEGEML